MVSDGDWSGLHHDNIMCVARSAEYDQTQTGVTRVRMWAGMGDNLGDDDVMISASVDEVLDR